MAKVPVSAKPDFLKSVSSAKPVPALAELIWNGFDAGAVRVTVTFDENDAGGLRAIHVRDTGSGMNPDDVPQNFGDLGQSWKRNHQRINGRALHGKKGRGRFKAFALGKHVRWVSAYQGADELACIAVWGDSDSLESFDVEVVDPSGRLSPGTDVTVETIAPGVGALRGATAFEHLARIFAPYLSDYPGTELWVGGGKVDPSAVQSRDDRYDLRSVTLDDRIFTVQLRVVEWTISVERTFQLCNANGFALHELPVAKRIKAPGYHFTLYLISELFDYLDASDQLALAELHPKVQSIIDDAKREAGSHFARRHLEDNKDKVDRWKAAEIYPYLELETESGVKLVERQVFDILASQVEEHLPAFETSSGAQQRLIFRLLAQAIGDNPDSVRVILEEVLSLGREERDDLAMLLKKTSLPRIISSAKTVAGRIDFVEALSDLVFNRATKKMLLERDQLHKILDSEVWIFREDFHLTGSEKRLEDVLRLHLDHLGPRSDECDVDVLMEGQRQGRVDLMLSKALRPTQDRFEYLVVELKRPSTKISSTVLTQIESYAVAVSSDPRFHQANNKWTFIVVGNEFDPQAARKARQKNRPDGLIYDDGEVNVSVWAYTWAEILDSARARLAFMSKQLSYEADSDSTVAYLRKTHSKYLPEEVLAELE